MTKRNIKLSVTSFLLVFSIFILAGCDNKNDEKKQNQDQAKEQVQTTEQKEATEDEIKTDKSKGNMKGEPPAEMTAACSEKSEGDSCTVAMTMPNKNSEENSEEKTMEGSCKKMENSETLSCTPNSMPQGEPREEK